MKPLLILARIIFVGLFWSVFFLEGIRVIMLTNWRFDIVRSSHWQHAWDLWLSGWVIDDPKEWAFVLIIITFIPLWLTGWAALSLVAWGKLFLAIILFPLKLFNSIFYKPVKIIANSASIKSIKKKKSYKEVRPRGIRAPIDDRADLLSPRPNTISTLARRSKPSVKSSIKDSPAQEKSFDHSLFQFDNTEEDDFDFNFDAFDKLDEDKKVESTKESLTTKNDDRENNSNNRNNSNNGNNNKNRNNNSKERKPASNQPQPQSKPAPNQPQQRSGGNSTLEVIKQKGYEVITGATIKNNMIDFIGIAEKQICICLIDKEPGD